MDRKTFKRNTHARAYGSLDELQKSYKKFLAQYTQQEIAMDTIRSRGIKPLRRTKKQLEGSLEGAWKTIEHLQKALKEERDVITKLQEEKHDLKKKVVVLQDSLKNMCQSMYKIVETL